MRELVRNHSDLSPADRKRAPEKACKLGYRLSSSPLAAT